MSNMDRAHERLSLAVRYLATQPGSLRARALDAYRQHVSVLWPDEFNDFLRPKFEELNDIVSLIVDRTTRNPAPWNLELHGGPYEIAKRKIRESTGRKIAMLIWRLYADAEFSLFEELRVKLDQMEAGDS